jgi:hypothetical protein
MAFNDINNQLQYVAKHGNYVDLMNAMTLLNSYCRIYSIGKAPEMKLLRGGLQAASISNLNSMLTGPTGEINSIHEFNNVRKAFFEYILETNPGVYDAIDPTLYSRLGIALSPREPGEYPFVINDCDGNPVVGSPAADTSEYLIAWNDDKVAKDFALCGTRTPYLYDTGVDNAGGASYLVESLVQFDNTKIIYNAPGVVNHRRLEEFGDNNKQLVRQEAQVKPQSIAKYSDRNI